MSIEIRKTTHDDVDAIMPIFDIARKTIATLGIDQWQDGYPTTELIHSDVDNGISYVVLNNGTIIGTFVLLFDGEPDYNVIYDGRWKTNGSYITVHRITVTPSERGGKTTAGIFTYIQELAKQSGMGAIRIDTHRGNLPMRKCLDKNGFVHCGSIYLRADGKHRVAYEKVL